MKEQPDDWIDLVRTVMLALSFMFITTCSARAGIADALKEFHARQK